jgi:hypothetical protein
VDEPEFLFELRVCRWAEREWPPTGGRDRRVLVGRQLGTKHRRWDTVVLECDPQGLEARVAFGDERLDSDLLHVVQNAPVSWSWYRDALPHPGYPWRYVREAVHRAAHRGLVETRDGENGRIELRRTYRYPDWVERVVAIENKPDLDASAARDLAAQVERDVALGLADEVWIATRTTGDDVEPALLERLPVEAGILAVDDRETAERSRNTRAGSDRTSRATRELTADVAWHANALAVDDPGTRILERPDGGQHDASAARFEYADPEWKREKRLEIAERAYERGWRSFVESMRTDCRQFRVTDPSLPLPYCAAKGRHVMGAECRAACPEFEPEPPAWRSKGWPLDGGPGAATKRVLDRQRERRR